MSSSLCRIWVAPCVLLAGAWSLNAGVFVPNLETALPKVTNHAQQRFGNSTAVDGLNAAVGAPGELLDPANPRSPQVGVVHLYRREPVGWRFLQRITPPGDPAATKFGFSVALQGNTLAVGAYLDSQVEPWSGAIHLYTLEGGLWTWTQTLRPDEVAGDQIFGLPVALSDDLLVAGALGETGTDNQGWPTRGAVYVFRRSDAGWIQAARLLSPNPGSDEGFGWWVDVDRGTVVVGAPDAAVYTADGWILELAGAAYVYEHVEEDWRCTATLLSRQPRLWDHFGLAVAVAGETVAVGTPWGGSLGGGAVEVFRKADGAWVPGQRLEPEDGQGNEAFGFSLALRGETLLAGAPTDSWFDQVPQAGGSVYWYELQGDAWAFRGELAAADRSANARFGHSVCLDGRSLAIGAPNQVVGGNAGTAAWQGAVTVLEQNQPPVADASRTPSEVVALDGNEARVILDAEASVDEDGDPLAFAWYAGDTLLGESGRLPVTLAVGTHALLLRVTDGRALAEATWTIDVLPGTVNEPPAADASRTSTRVIAPSARPVRVTLDGSASSDPDGDPLTFRWTLNGVLLADRSLAHVELAPGTYNLHLEVSDGQATAHTDLTLRVITATQAIKALKLRLELAHLPRGRTQSGLALLTAAGRALDHRRPTLAVHQLTVFQQLMLAGRIDRRTVQPLIREAGEIIRALQQRS